MIDCNGVHSSLVLGRYAFVLQPTTAQYTIVSQRRSLALTCLPNYVSQSLTPCLDLPIRPAKSIMRSKGLLISLRFHFVRQMWAMAFVHRGQIYQLFVMDSHPHGRGSDTTETIFKGYHECVEIWRSRRWDFELGADKPIMQAIALCLLPR